MNKIKQTSIEATEELNIKNPLTEARRKEELIEAREKVRETRNILNNCLRKNKGNSSACKKEKEAYDKSVKRYSELQKL